MLCLAVRSSRLELGRWRQTRRPCREAGRPGKGLEFSVRYPGGKNGSGVYQTIINQMPPHRVYIEPFLGSGAVMRRKRAASVNIGVDRSSRAAGALRNHHNAEFVQGDGIGFLHRFPWRGGELVYCDPPYLLETRSSKKRIYTFEMTALQHQSLLTVLQGLPCMAIVSGYRSELYDAALSGWRSFDFQAMTRGGVATETLWLNFPEPVALHDYSFIGSDYRERERIRRKIDRWIRRLDSLPRLERAAILSAMPNLVSPRQAVSAGLAVSPGVTDPHGVSDDAPGRIARYVDERRRIDPGQLDLEAFLADPVADDRARPC